MKTYVWAALLSAATVLEAADADARLRGLVRTIQAEVKPDAAMAYVRDIHATDRWFTFPKFRTTAEYLSRAMAGIGLSDVEILSAPADGVTQYGFHTMPLAWDARRARLEIVEPAVPADQRVLADYETTPASLGMWSGPTPPGGVIAEVVEMATDSPAEVAKLDMKGKLVLTRPNLLGLTYSLKWMLVKGGALGAINAFTENSGLRDGRHWVNFWGDSGWAFTKASTPLLSYSITPRQAELLHNLLARHSAVRLKAVAETRYYSGSYPYVTGVLRGAASREEVLELGHTSEHGANDNATGVAAMLEAIGALNRLIASGKLPRPRRGIRILAMGELYPTMHYLATHRERVRGTVASICLDAAAGPYGLTGTEYTFRANPDVARSYTDALIARVAEAYFPLLAPPRPFHMAKYGTGSDEFLPDPLIGIPTIRVVGRTGVHTHHNSEDTLERVDSQSLRDLAVVTAAFLYTVANADQTQAPWLAEMAADRGCQQIARVAGGLVDGVFAAGDGLQMGRLLAAGVERIDYAVDRESQAVRSVLRLAPEERREAAAKHVAAVLEDLSHFGRKQADRLRNAAGARARQLGIQVEPLRPQRDPIMAEAARMVVVRKRFGTLPLDDLAVERWEGYPYASWDLAPVTALYWCDGRRTLAEVIRLTRMEVDAAGFDFAGYFRFLARHGYVTLIDSLPRN
jgi:hypothetical protein